jgi:hypothetical protein
MDLNNPKILYTCTSYVYKCSDATVSSPQWVSMGSMGTVSGYTDGAVTGSLIQCHTTDL